MSDKKKLLEESTIRRFMKLANIKPLNEMEGNFAGGAPMHDEARFAGGGRPAPGGMREELEEEGMEEEEVGGEEEAPEALPAPEMGGAEGGGLKAKVESLVDAFNALLEELPDMEGTEIGVEDAEHEAGEEEHGGEEMEEEGSLYEELEEEGLTEELEEEEEGITEELEEEGYVKEEGKKPAFLKKGEKDKEVKEEGKHKGMKEEGKKKMEEKKKLNKEDLAEELTRRVAARLMAEMTKHSKFVKKGTTGPKALTGAGTKSHGPVKGHGPKKVAPYNKHVGVKGLGGKGKGK